MKSKVCLNFVLLCLFYQVSINKGADILDSNLEDRLMKLESSVGKLKDNEQELKGKVGELKKNEQQLRGKVGELKENEKELKGKVATLEEQIKLLEMQDAEKVNQIKRLEEKVETLTETKEVIPGQDVPRTCHELWRMGETVDGEYEVDPDGNNNGYPPIKVHCSFYQDGANTVIPLDGLDLNMTLDVNATSCHSAGCFNVKVNYTSPIPQIVALSDLSRDCQQFIEYGCENAPLEVNDLPMGWWTDRNSNPQYYWTNTTENKHICSCGLDNSCVEQEMFGNLCNCDANLPIKETDRGYIKNSSALPITELSAGTFYGKASFSLGHMKCFGEATYNNGESCDAYRKAGATLSGYYLTMPSGNSTNSTTTNTPQVSLCDMTKSSKDPEFQTDVGVLGEFGRGPPVTFNAIRSSEFTEANSMLPFDNTTVNIGDAFDNGTFTAPVDGLYHFAFHGFSTSAMTSSGYWSRYSIYKNQEILATAIANNYYYSSYSDEPVAYESFSTSFYEFLDSGDSIYVKTGDYVKLYDSDSEHVTQFSGSLMQ